MGLGELIIFGFIGLVVFGGLFILFVWASMIYSMLFKNDLQPYLEYKYTEAILNNADQDKWNKK